MSHQVEDFRWPIEAGIKRKRLILSCFECKRRKLKCDRQYPTCTRCSEVGNPGICRYDDRVTSAEQDYTGNDSISGHQAISMASTSRVSSIDASVNTTFGTRNGPLHSLDQISVCQFDRCTSVGGLANINPLTPTSSDQSSVSGRSATNPPSRPNGTISSSKCFETQFRGASHSVNIVALFDDIQDFLRKSISDHPILGAPKWATKRSRKAGSLPIYSTNDIEGAMRELLPPEGRCRQLMQSYMDHFDGMYTLFHGPTFWQSFEKFWNGSYEVPQEFIAILLAAMSCSRCLYIDEPLSFDGDSSSARMEALRWVHAAESWLLFQSAKHTTLETFQIKCLLLISKTLNAIKIKRLYIESQTLLATAISVGMHRHSEGTGVSESIYEREMRRRIWCTITELDMDRCIERGLPSMVSNLYCDIGSPSNFRDSDFSKATLEEPDAQPDSVLSTVSYMRHAYALSPLRHQINTLVNNPTIHKSLTSAQLLLYHQQILGHFVKAASCFNAAEDSNLANKASVLKSLLDMHLHQLLILLHLPFALEQKAGIDSSHSRFICTSSASSIIKTYESFQKCGLSHISLPRTNLMRASFTLCLIQFMPTGHDLGMACVIEPYKANLVESALDMIEERVIALGSGFRGFWLLFAASCYLESHKEPSAFVVWQKKMTDRIIGLFSNICLSQLSNGPACESTDDLFARYVMHIQRTCDYAAVGSRRDGAPSLGQTRAANSPEMLSTATGISVTEPSSNVNWMNFQMDNWAFTDLNES